MNKLINKVKENQYKLKYQQLGAHIRIVVFTDVAFQNLSDMVVKEDKLYFLQIVMPNVIHKLPIKTYEKNCMYYHSCRNNSNS